MRTPYLNVTAVRLEAVSIPFQNSEQAGEFNETLEEVSVVFPAGYDPAVVV